MSTVSKTSILLNDIPLDCSGFMFTLTSGTQPSEVTVVVSSVVGKRLAGISDKTNIRLKITDPHKKTINITGIVMTSLRDMGHGDWEIGLADSRVLLEDTRISGAFNVIRLGGDIDESSATVSRNASPNPRDRFKPRHFLAHTLKDKTKDDFFRGKASTSLMWYRVQGKPWTALEAIRWMFGAGLDKARKRGLSKHPQLHIDEGVKDNGYVLQSFVFAGEPFLNILSVLAAKARVAVSVDVHGRILIHNPYEKVTRKFIHAEGWDKPVKTVLSHRKPKKINVLMRSEYEVMMHYDEQDAFGVNGTTVLRDPTSGSVGIQALVNVVQLPDDVRSYKRGQWVPVSTAMELWKSDWSTATVPAPSTSNLREYMSAQDQFVPLLTINTSSGTGAGDPRLMARWSALAGAYRRIFQINERMRGYILKWRPLLVSIVDPLTGRRAKSPVWCPYTALFTGPRQHKRGSKQHDSDWAWGYAFDDPSINSDAKPAPFEVVMVDQSQGVFQVVPHNPMSSLDPVLEFILGEAEADSKFDPVAHRTVQLAQSTATMKANFQLKTLLSFIPIDSDMDGYEFDIGGKYEVPYEVFVRNRTLKWQWRYGTTSVDVKRGAFRVFDAMLANSTTTRAYAQMVVDNIKDTFNDRLEGMFHVAHPELALRLEAHASSLRFEVDPQGEVTAVMVFPDVLPAKDTRSLLPVDMRQSVLRELQE